MIIDSSAIVAILRREPEWIPFAELIRQAPTRFMSAGTYIELSVVIGRLHQIPLFDDFDKLLHVASIDIVDVTAAQARIGRRAYLQFGKGSGHPAKLNFGDCFAYALAIDLDEPLLFKGNDFIHTDIRIAVPPATT